MSQLKKASEVTQGEGDRSLVIFKFSGIHDYTHGRQMDEYMKSMVSASPTDGIIIDLLDYEYVYGDDVTVLFMAGFDQQSQALGPVCVVAVGATRAGLESLLAASKFRSEGGLDVAVMPTIEEARQAVSAMRKTAVERPKTARVPPPGLPATVPTAGELESVGWTQMSEGEWPITCRSGAELSKLYLRTGSTLQKSVQRWRCQWAIPHTAPFACRTACRSSAVTRVSYGQTIRCISPFPGSMIALVSSDGSTS